MPIGYLVTTGLIAATAVAAVFRHRPRRSSPFRLSYVFGFLLNWPLAVLLFLAASTALAVTQSGASLGFWIGLGFTVVASAGLVVLGSRARGTRATVERALDEGLGPGWRDAAPIVSRRRGVRRIGNIRYGPARRGNLLDLYRDRLDHSGRPTLIYLHPGAFRFGSKRVGARHLLRRLASDGWVCISANYRLAEFPDPLIDVKKVIAWVREHGDEYGVDPTAVFIAGGSAGAHLASMAALTPNDPVFQPGFEGADTSVAGAIGLYGYYGPITSDERASSPVAYATPKAPPFFLAHGDQDTLVVVEDARRFADELRATSSSPVVYAELPGAQHGFDVFRSRRLGTVIDAIEAFAAWVRSGQGPAVTLPRGPLADSSKKLIPRQKG